MSDRQVVRAAGGIVIRGEGDGREVLLVHRPRYDDWSFPKGKLVDGEGDEQAAVREVEEETGLRCQLDRHVGAVTYTDRQGRPKIVRYWAMTPIDGSFTPSSEVDEISWTRLTSASELLSYRHDRDVLAATMGRAALGPVYVVRHAKAGERTRWGAPDDQRPLTRRGRRQAMRLVERFRGLEVSRIVSSPFVRCVQSVEPLARSRGLDVEPVAELAEDVEVADAAAFVWSLDARPTVVSAHGKHVQGLIETLRGWGAHVEGVGGLAKGSVWVLDRREGEIVSARYLPAPPG